MSRIREGVIIGPGLASHTAAPDEARARPKLVLFGGSIFAGGSLTTTTKSRTTPDSWTVSTFPVQTFPVQRCPSTGLPALQHRATRR